MEDLLLFAILYVIIFSFYMLFFIIRRKAKRKILEVMYLESKYKLDMSKFNIKKVKKHIALINSLIFTITIFIMSLFSNIALKVLVAFATVMTLILIFYKLLAILYKNKK